MAHTTPSSSRTIRIHRSLISGAIAAGFLGVMTLAGCVSYTNVPTPESPPAFNTANHFQAKRVARVALDEVIQRFPMRDSQGRYSINLPAGTTLETAQEIIDWLPEGGVLPHEGMDDSIPVYHIGRIWIRASDAKVDVLYPARSFDGGAFTGNVTVWLNGGVRRWKLNRMQHWAPGTNTPPPIYVPIPLAEMNAIEAGEDQGREPIEPEPTQAEPTTDTPEPTAVTQPVREPAAEDPARTDPGTAYREVPVDG